MPIYCSKICSVSLIFVLFCHIVPQDRARDMYIFNVYKVGQLVRREII